MRKIKRLGNSGVCSWRKGTLLSKMSFILRAMSLVIFGQIARVTCVEPIKCLDYIPTSLCQGALLVYGAERCSVDILFGRYQCCWTCAANLDLSIDTNGRFQGKGTFQFYHPGCPDNAKDSMDALGQSFTPWCVLWKDKNDGNNCELPLFQYRCYKTCQVECGSDELT